MEEVGHSKDNKRSRCSVITCLSCPVGHKLFMVISVMGKAPNLDFFKRERKVSLGPAGSPLPSAQNNPHVKVAHLGEACESLQNDKQIFKN